VRVRLLIIFLFLSGVCQSQSLLSKQVLLARKEGTTQEFLDDLSKASGITLSYSSGVVTLSRKVQVTGQEKTVGDFLKTILKDQHVKYEEQGEKIFLVAEHPIKKKFTVSGYVTDSKSGERLIGTSLFVFNKKLGTTSNAYGFYSLTLEEDSIQLHITHAGYIGSDISFQLGDHRSLDIALEPRVVMNEVVVVNAESKMNSQNRTLPGRINVSSSFIKSMPSLLGEPDVLKALQLLPGIQGGNEGTAGLNVRGGSADQNLVLLDGVPVYNASHAFGFFSIFNADAVQNVEVLKSGFPASYGGRLSSVIDVQMKEGDKYKFHGEGGVGLIFSKLTLEGPWKKGRSSFLVSARRTYADLILRPIMKLSEEPTDLRTYFSDIIAKSNFPIGEKDRIYFSFYTGKDKYRSVAQDPPAFTQYLWQRYEFGFSWGNITGMARWNHVFNKKLFSNFTFNYSRFRFDANEQNDFEKSPVPYVQQFKQNYFSSIQDHNIKYDIDYLPAPDHFIKMGVAATLHHYRPGVRSVFQKDSVVKIDRRIEEHSVYTGEYELYAEDDIRFSSRNKANIGVRLAGFNVSNSTFFSIQPRLNWVYKLTPKFSLKASAVKMNQYIHLLTNSNMGLPTDLWVPVTKRVRPQRSYQFSGGVSYNHDQSMEASMEVYYKHFKNVIEYKEGAGFTSFNLNWEDLVELGKGQTYGAEWLLQKRKGEITGLIGYTLSWSNRKFPNINGGKTFPYKYDRRHEIKMAVVWKPSKRFEMGADWILATGNAISMPVGWYRDPYGRDIDIYEGRNDFRMPLYHRLDVSIKMSKQKKRHQRTWTLGLYNAYNHWNTFFIYRDTSYDPATRLYSYRFRRNSLFPMLPSVSYQFKF
jgi:hypothetical protein